MARRPEMMIHKYGNEGKNEKIMGAHRSYGDTCTAVEDQPLLVVLDFIHQRALLDVIVLRETGTFALISGRVVLGLRTSGFLTGRAWCLHCARGDTVSLGLGKCARGRWKDDVLIGGSRGR